MEFIVKTDLSKEALTTIDFNYSELKAELARNLAQYKGMEVTEADIPTAKKDLAMLRKLNTAMDSERKRIKKAWNEPYTEFEAKVKELQGLVMEPISEIATQLEGYEERRKAEKMAALRAYYDEKAGKLTEYIPWERIADSRWANVTYAMADAQTDIDIRIDNVFKDIETLSQTEDFILYSEPVMKKYRECGDIREALGYLGHLKAVKKEWEKAQERQAAEAAKTAEEQPQQPAGRIREIEQPAPAPAAPGAPKYSLSFTATGTKEQLNALADYMYQHGIAYKRIAK